MILITGVSGILGSSLLTELLKDNTDQSEIIGLYRKNQPKIQHPRVRYIALDLLDIKALEAVFQKGIEQVYHCAAIVSFDKRDQERIIYSNVTATAHIVDLCIEYQIAKLVHISSVAAISKNQEKKNKTLTEDDFWESFDESTSTYAKSKHLAEMEVWRGAAEGLQVSILNPGVIIGAPPHGDWSQSSATLFRTVANGLKWFTNGINSFVGTRDVARAAILCMHNSRANQERYIISTGNYSYRDIFARIAQALTVQAPYREATPLMSGFIWRLNSLLQTITGKRFTITKETAQTAHSQYNYSNDKFINTFPDFHYQDIYTVIDEVAALYPKS